MVTMKSFGRIAAAACTAAGLWAASAAHAQENTQLALTRNNADGTKDTSFHNDGRRLFNLDSINEELVAVAASGNKIVAAGSAVTGNGQRFLVARFNEDSSLDTTFDGDGFTTLDFGDTQPDAAKAIAIDSSGRIVVAGSSGDHMAIARLNANGSLDTSFGQQGMKLVSFLFMQSRATTLKILSNGRIVMAGAIYLNEQPGFGVVRLTSTGALDTSFHGEGGFAFGLCSGASAEAMGVDSSNRVVVAGNCYDGKVAVARLTSAGELDTTFSGDGQALVLRPNSFADQVYGLTIDSSNRVLLAGASGNDVQVTRLTSGGAVDTAFGASGFARPNIPTVSEGAYAITFAGSKLALGGWAVSNNQFVFLTARLTSTGALDTTFNGGKGYSTQDFSTTNWEEAKAVAVDAKGRIVSVGPAGDLDI